MQGTHSIGSLLRLCLGAALLCVAWVLLSAATADAAQPPTPVGGAVPHVDVATLTNQLLDTTASAVVQLQTTAASSVDAGAAAVKAVAAVAAPVAPVLEQPVSDVADDVVAVVDSVPVVGRQPVLEVPLPHLPAAPLPPKTPEVTLPGSPTVSEPETDLAGVAGKAANSVAPQAISAPSSQRVAAAPGARSATLISDEGSNSRLEEPRSASRPSPVDTPSPADEPGPGPIAPSAPMPPTNPVPTSGGSPSMVDFAALGPIIVLLCPATGRSSSADWRLPHALPAQPGARPD